VSDRIVGFALALLAGWYGWSAGDYEADFADPLGPTVFPRLLAPIIGFLGLWLVFRPDPEPEWSGGRTLVIQSTAVVLMLAYALLLVPVGFLLSTTALAAILAAMLGARPLPAAASGAVVSVGCYLLFTRGLKLALPTGTLLTGG
jgi:putative tricarboxylic transport membrane protein